MTKKNIDKKLLQELAQNLNKLTNDKYIIRIGNYIGNYYEEGKFKKISGELFIKTNSDTLFRVVSHDSDIFDDFDIIEDNATIKFIDKELENSRINYNSVDIHNKSSLRSYFPKNEIGKEMFECVQSVPPRFRKDALDLFNCADDENMWTWKTVDEAWCYFLDDIIPEMNKEEKEKYGF